MDGGPRGRRNIGRRVVLAGFLLVGAVLAVGVDTPQASAGAPTGELVYVANEGGGPVDAYAADSTGAVTPVLTVANPDRPNTVWDPWGVTFDSSGDLYVQTFLSDATTFVFGPHATGTSRPIRIFRVDGPDSRAIAVDGNGYEYVGTGDGPYAIEVAAPAARGHADDLYDVRPVRTITPDQSGFQPWPDILAEGAADQLVAAIVRDQGNAIETFAGGPRRGDTPLSVIAGPRTGLGSCSNSCQNLSVAYAPLTRGIVVAVTDGSHTHISVFGRQASGNVTPLRTIEGPGTGLSGAMVTGIAVSPTTGDIYAMVKPAEFSGPSRMEVFSNDATGNTAPLRTFTDRSDKFATAMGIAVRARS
jgi:hypothetical protein